MQIDFKTFTLARLALVWSDPFVKIVSIALCALCIGLGFQLYSYWSKTASVPLSETVVEVNMRVIPGQWTWEPDRLEIPSGARVEMTIDNGDPYAHGFAITELGLDQRLPPNQVTRFSFDVTVPPGEYDFFCSIYCGVGHFGQRGKLIVTEPESAGQEERTDSVTPTLDERDLPVRSRADAIDELPYEENSEGVKVFALSIDEILWDYGDGNPVHSFGYNTQLPGPDIRVTEGDRVRFEVTNNLPEATTVHWHGIDIEWAADGVPGVTQDPIKPGETYTYEFTAYPAGTRFYHTHGSHHGDEAEQMDMGLAGAFIVEPPEPAVEPPDQDITWVLTERIRYGIFPIHGAIYPAVPEIVVQEGDRVRVRLINAGSSTFHPMHLHGHQFTVVAVDGNPVPEPAQLIRNTLPILPGETYDIEFIANNPGLWMFHCHELQHAAGGMIGYVRYEGFDAPAFSSHH